MLLVLVYFVLQHNESSLDTFKKLLDPSHNSSWPTLDRLPPSPTLLNSTSVRYQDLLPILNSKQNASSSSASSLLRFLNPVLNSQMFQFNKE